MSNNPFVTLSVCGENRITHSVHFSSDFTYTTNTRCGTNTELHDLMKTDTPNFSLQNYEAQTCELENEN